MKTLYIHIGTPKTGTTSIQSFCVANTEKLESMGYAYPPCPHAYPGVSVKRNNARFLVGTILDEKGECCEKEENKIFYEGMEKIKELFESHDRIILSDEAIWRTMDMRKKDLWKNLKQMGDEAGFQVKAIVYLRRQDKLICSLWNQKIKKVTGSLGEETFEEFLKRINADLRLDYYAKLERMAEVLGKENITVRRFEKENFLGGNIYADFLHTVDIDSMEGFVIPQMETNPGLYGNTHEIKRALNGLPEMRESKNENFFRNILKECSEISGKRYPCEMLSEEEARELLARYEEGNRKITEEYLGEEGTELFDNSMKDVPKWEPDNPYFREDLIRFIGAGNLCLKKENEKLQAEIVKLREEVKKLAAEQREFKEKVKHPFHTAVSKVFKK